MKRRLTHKLIERLYHAVGMRQRHNTGRPIFVISSPYSNLFMTKSISSECCGVEKEVMAYATQTIRQRIPRGNELAGGRTHRKKFMPPQVCIRWLPREFSNSTFEMERKEQVGNHRFDTDKMCFLRARLVYSDSI